MARESFLWDTGTENAIPVVIGTHNILCRDARKPRPEAGRGSLLGDDQLIRRCARSTR